MRSGTVAAAPTRPGSSWTTAIRRGAVSSQHRSVELTEVGRALLRYADEFHVFVHPIIIGGGNPWLPRDLRIPLELAGERRLGGVVHLHYRRAS